MIAPPLRDQRPIDIIKEEQPIQVRVRRAPRYRPNSAASSSRKNSTGTTNHATPSPSQADHQLPESTTNTRQRCLPPDPVPTFLEPLIAHDDRVDTWPLGLLWVLFAATGVASVVSKSFIGLGPEFEGITESPALVVWLARIAPKYYLAGLLGGSGLGMLIPAKPQTVRTTGGRGCGWSWVRRCFSERSST